ncbi:SDR family oxidoreductase [Paraburkholderia graminis]|uniref:SDR family oxidoreductase n=1 Tax=Paraburkholderia graminis TaxID=60548 RepID=UPI00278FEB0C|nr:SDR family oxidoreductase [Paraburkholderia graminis]MDQ0625950.1 NAD(P)-dependent dehydrogenase (short-subunit alcohol dehydrogenase family) [Paraburkholderia graminis]
MANTVLITGCSSGFGRATALEFARQGWNVIATMRTPAPDSMLASQPGVFVTRLDVQDPASIAQAIADGITQFGSIDVIINNAGFAVNTIFEAVPPEKVQEMFEVNVFGAMAVIRAILPHFRHTRSGIVINVSSGAGVFGLPMASLYNATKFALEGFSEGISYELAAIGVVVKLVEPGAAPDTGFPSRSGAESASVTAPAVYQPFVSDAQHMFQAFRNGASSDAIAQVAQGIYRAATDGSDRLRYVLSDDIKPMIVARRETGEEAYIAFMRSIFPYRQASPNTAS